MRFVPGRKLAAPNPRPHCDVRGSDPLPPQCKAALAFHCKQEEQHQFAPCSQGRAVPVPVVLLQAADRDFPLLRIDNVLWQTVSQALLLP